MEKNFDIFKAIQFDLNYYKTELQRSKEKLDEDFLYNLDGYLKGFIIESYVKTRILHAQKYITDNEKAIDWIEHNIQILSKELLTQSLSSSTNKVYNLKEEFEQEAKRIVLEKISIWYARLTGKNATYTHKYLMFTEY